MSFSPSWSARIFCFLNAQRWPRAYSPTPTSPTHSSPHPLTHSLTHSLTLSPTHVSTQNPSMVALHTPHSRERCWHTHKTPPPAHLISRNSRQTRRWSRFGHSTSGIVSGLSGHCPEGVGRVFLWTSSVMRQSGRLCDFDGGIYIYYLLNTLSHTRTHTMVTCVARFKRYLKAQAKCFRHSHHCRP